MIHKDWKQSSKYKSKQGNLPSWQNISQDSTAQHVGSNQFCSLLCLYNDSLPTVQDLAEV